MATPSSDSHPATTRPANRVPFVIGVTGNMDPDGYHDDRTTCDASLKMIELRKTIEAIFDWVRGVEGVLDPIQGRFLPPSQPSSEPAEKQDGWAALGMVNSPILILSSLAPGIDTVVVETALDYAAKHPEAEISILAPLPFPADIYRDATTFNTPAREKRFDDLRARLGESRLFEVALDNDLLSRIPDEALHDLTATDPNFGDKPRRHLRYRAAGEYVAVHSDLLLAAFDEAMDTPKLDNLFEAGSATIVEAKRRGLTHELLAVTNNFAWADNGPVLLIPIRRQKRKDLPGLPPPGPMRFLHPYDLLPQGVQESDDQHPAWQETGDTRFRRVLKYQEKFNRLGEARGEQEERTNLTGELSEVPASGFAEALDPIARVRRRAVMVSRRLTKDRKSLLSQMFWLILAAATLYGCFEHWHHKDHHAHDPSPGQVFPDDAMIWTQILLLLGTFSLLICSGLKYYRHVKSGAEEDRFDYRAIGEALRVQFFWKLAGTGRSVAADYMQRQRDELDWIRYVVSSISMPHEVTREAFLGLPRASQVQLLDATRKNWLGEQIRYFQGAPGQMGSAEQQEKKAHLWHTCGWALAAAGLTSMFLMLLAKLFVPVKQVFENRPCQVVHWLIWPGLLLLTFLFVKSHLGEKQASKAHSHGDLGHGGKASLKGFLLWIFGNPFAWGSALVLAGLIGGISHTLGKSFHYWPDGYNWWIVLTGTALLGGALCVAWAERNFYAEEARQYRAMGNLFACADRRLQGLIQRYAEAPATGTTTDRILFEIHDILHQLGCEALDENAEWLIQHRSRPLEMLMAG